MTRRTKSNPKPETYEDFLASTWRDFANLGADKESNVHPPTYHYTVGESVILGNLSEPRVEEVLKDGKLLHVSSHDRGETYGKPYDNQRRLPHLVWWMDVVPVAPIESTNFARPRTHQNYRQCGLDSLINLIYFRGLIDNPDYQRGYVWTLEDKQRLVRSIFNRADIGKFLFVEHPYPEHRLEIVDGKQRLNAIREFYESRFAYEGKTWFQLSRADKWAFQDVMVQMATLDAERVSKADILWQFLSLNVGGVPQTEDHIAHAKKLYEEAVQKMDKEADA